MPVMEIRILESINDLEAGTWDSLFASDYPFTRHAFLKALEETGSASAQSGWIPRHRVVEQAGKAVAAMPVFEKDNSYGEFVFDWAWADAYQRHGLAYYPKLVTAAPFTPASGPRIGFGESDQGVVSKALLDEVLATRNVSSWHLLFPDAELEEQISILAQSHDLLRRQDVQFHWNNRGYSRFDDFLATLKSSRRKTLRRERKLVSEAGIELERLEGEAIGEQHWDQFYHCYVSTYLKRSGHGGYLNREFFTRIGETMPASLMMVIARKKGRLVASALFFRDSQALYGRYWGAVEQVNCLHFETCFYQGIEYCIEQGLERFDPGTQGEHKLMRGFEPTETASWHWIGHSAFRDAISRYLDQEKKHMKAYGDQAGQFLPYRRDEVAQKQ